MTACDTAPARWLAVQRDPALTLATSELLIAPEQAAAFADACTLAAALATLHRDEQARIAAACDAARMQGQALGRAEGHASALAEAAPRLAEGLAALHTRSTQELQALHAAVVPLALLVLRRVAASLAPEDVLAALLRQALEQVQADAGAARTTVRLHPALLPAVRAAMGDAAAALAWRADDTLAPLDCVFDTPAGRVLAGLETQLARVQAALQQVQHSAAAVGA